MNENPPDMAPAGTKTSEDTVEAGAHSEDGKWFWDGSRWSALHTTITGSVIPRILAWTLMGALPLAALGALPIGSLLSKVNTIATVCGVAVVFFAAEALVVYLILRKTPRITVDRGKMTIGHLLNGEGRSISVQAISSIELVRGSIAMLALSEGGEGEGRVLVHLVQGSTIELSWDAFADRANTLAWILGVSLNDAAADARRARAATLQVQDPGREKRQRVLVSVGVLAVVLVVMSSYSAHS